MAIAISTDWIPETGIEIVMSMPPGAMYIIAVWRGRVAFVTAAGSIPVQTNVAQSLLSDLYLNSAPLFGDNRCEPPR